jgi:putative restriction endonuclease
MKLYVGVTDNDWFRFLKARPDLDEINFWQPSGSREFRLLNTGEPFLFKLHSPQNFIVGGGYQRHQAQVGPRKAETKASASYLRPPS